MKAVQPLPGRWSLHNRLTKDLRPLMHKLGDVLLDIERLQEDPALQRDVKTALRAIEKVYGTMTKER